MSTIHKRALGRALGLASLAALVVGLACAPEPDACANIETDVQNSFGLLKKFVKIETFRTDEWANEDKVTAGMMQLRAELQAQIDDFNKGQKHSKLELSMWEQSSDKDGKRDPNEPPFWRVFKVRFGQGPRKVALVTHLDTVGPGNVDWDAFNLRKQNIKRENGEVQEFWIGRGAIDDKGPAIATFQTIKAIARKYDGSPLLDDITVELVFDTSEETSFSTSHFFELNPKEEPDLAVIFDANWCIRAEKGIERPVFTLAKDAAPPPSGVWIDSFNTPAGPTNQIPDFADATIKSDDPAKIDALFTGIRALYDKFTFDVQAGETPYRHAELSKLEKVGTNGLHLQTKVAGAQHGSKPDENRADGANPLISLGNFLAYLSAQQKWVENDRTRMLEFLQWTWGTKVFGEGHNHPQLEASDEVFTKGNGTTYAVTRFDDSGDKVTLKVDIRYAMNHHNGPPWDGKTEGFLNRDQKSKFGQIFGDLVQEFNKVSNPTNEHLISVTVRPTAIPPDIRRPDGPTFKRVSNAYREVIGTDCPALAIGGGTDAKDHTNFLAAGALFTTKFGPPINFHGILEGAPVPELTKSAKIICRFVDDEVKGSVNPDAPRPAMDKSARTPWTSSHDDLH